MKGNFEMENYRPSSFGALNFFQILLVLFFLIFSNTMQHGHLYLNRFFFAFTFN